MEAAQPRKIPQRALDSLAMARVCFEIDAFNDAVTHFREALLCDGAHTVFLTEDDMRQLNYAYTRLCVYTYNERYLNYFAVRQEHQQHKENLISLCHAYIDQLKQQERAVRKQYIDLIDHVLSKKKLSDFGYQQYYLTAKAKMYKGLHEMEKDRKKSPYIGNVLQTLRDALALYENSEKSQQYTLNVHFLATCCTYITELTQNGFLPEQVDAEIAKMEQLQRDIIQTYEEMSNASSGEQNDDQDRKRWLNHIQMYVQINNDMLSQWRLEQAGYGDDNHE